MRVWAVFATLLVGWLALGERATEAMRGGLPSAACANAAPVPGALRLPTRVPPGEPVAVEQRLLRYLSSYAYRDLGWCVDKAVRDTGPYLDHVMYGTHTAVRIYYSPEMMAWLRGGRRGVPADGAVIIKEQYGAKPAAAFAGQGDATLRPTDWTIMIRRSSASRDGWFWGEVWTTMFGTQPLATTVAYPNAGFGLYCLRCHASAAHALTFSALENVRGFPGEPLRYRVDDSWRFPLPAPTPCVEHDEHQKNRALASVRARCAPSTPTPLAVQTFPPESLDTNLAAAHGGTAFLTSAQCMGCHSAAAGAPFGPTMWVTPAPSAARQAGLDVSEYGEWRWSPMGLAGRDPVFYAQLQSELTYLRTLKPARVADRLQTETDNTCLHCHGAMGERTLQARHPGARFDPAIVFDGVASHPDFALGGLARDGVSCTICHHAAATTTPPGEQPLAHFLAASINGDFRAGPADRLDGPFRTTDVAALPMKNAFAIKPAGSDYVLSSQLCGSCHTIRLPVVDAPPRARGAEAAHDIEQATYVEWLNSAYQTEFRPGSKQASCVACHMPAGIADPERGVAIAHLASRIALVQDDTYPATSNAAPADQLHVAFRERGYRRHELLGLNAFLLETFRQHPDVLGVRTADYMSGSTTGLADAIDHVVQQARAKTARVAVRAQVEGRTLAAEVEITNLTGHRFPSGVGFRRSFVEFAVYDGDAATPFFVSGATDNRGRIVGADGAVLPSESFATGADGREQYQPHFDRRHPVTSQAQAEIFEELTQDHTGHFTTSFIRRDHEAKDNRILPQGWRPGGPAPGAIPREFLVATYPKGGAAEDPAYRDGKGHAVVDYRILVPAGVDPARVRVKATLWYQSWAPYFLAARVAASDAAAVRLRALTEHLDLDGTELEHWKLRVGAATWSAPR